MTKTASAPALNQSDKAAQHKAHWSKFGEENLLGRTIVGVRYLTDKETEAMDWMHSSAVLVLDDGSLLFPSMDDEGNDGGALFGQTKDGKEITLPVI